MTAIIIFCILCVLLTAGKLLRLGVPLLQRLYLEDAEKAARKERQKQRKRFPACFALCHAAYSSIQNF